MGRLARPPSTTKPEARSGRTPSQSVAPSIANQPSKANRTQVKRGCDNPASTALARACCRFDRAERETEPNLDHNVEHDHRTGRVSKSDNARVNRARTSDRPFSKPRASRASRASHCHPAIPAYTSPLVRRKSVRRLALWLVSSI